jgi:hypothetical protein
MLGSEIVGEYISKGFAMKKKLIDDKNGLLEKTAKRLELMEMEGKFEISRQGIMLEPEKRPRNDKVYSYNMNHIEGIEEYKDLSVLTKLIYCIPFELNSHNPMF